MILKIYIKWFLAYKDENKRRNSLTTNFKRLLFNRAVFVTFFKCLLYLLCYNGHAPPPQSDHVGIIFHQLEVKFCPLVFSLTLNWKIKVGVVRNIKQSKKKFVEHKFQINLTFF